MKNSARWFGGLLLCSVTLLTTAPSVWAVDDDDDAYDVEITIKDMAFRYEGTSLLHETVELPAGATVRWNNVDPNITTSGLDGVMPHGVRILKDGKVIVQSSVLFQKNTTFEYKFTDPGVYDLQCIIHPSLMTARFVVFQFQQASLTPERHAAR
jgi:plastocyanin